MSSRARLTSLFVLAACGDPVGPADADLDAAPMPVTSFGFMQGSWDVTSRRVLADGSIEETTARSVVTAAFGLTFKEQWVGTRGGEPVELRTLLGASDRAGVAMMARGDGGAGTFDVLEGTFTDRRIELVSRTGSRPDGGLDRITVGDLTAQGFTLTVEASPDGGATWTPRETTAYRRAAAGTAIPAPPASAAGCRAAANRQFDFWQGDWMVGGAHNYLPLVLGGCILEENWAGAERGTSFNMYDPRTRLWTQVWMDTNGNTLVLHGGPVGDQMVLRGPHGPSEQRITWTPLAPGEVRQHGESSSDGGTTWSTLYDLTYTPR